MRLTTTTTMLAILALAAAAARAPLAAEEAPPGLEPGPRAAGVGALEIEGLKRTRPSVVERLLSPFLGLSPEELDLAEVARLLNDTGLFYDIEASIRHGEGGSPSLAVSVKEKSSLVPIPVVYSGGSGLTFGAAVLDSNAFGLNDKAVFVGMYNPEKWSAIASYARLPPGPGSFGFSAFTILSSGETQIVDAGDEELLAYEATAFDLGLALKRGLGPGLAVEAGLAYRLRSVEDEEAGSVQYLPLSLGISVRRSSWDGIFSSERSAALEAVYALALEGGSYPAFEARLAFEEPLLPGLRLVARASGLYAPEAPLVLGEGPMAASVAILPSDFRSSSLAGASAGLEARLAKTGPGSLTALASYQAAIAEDAGGEEIIAQGPSGGIRFYLAKVAFPALEIRLSHNLEARLTDFSFSLGMRM
ncbi:MAG TPA: hypothetical protein P5142_02500 [Spirochaetia bacterium]|nr:hypothetical protein [Spirochaetia bacterium]